MEARIRQAAWGFLQEPLTDTTIRHVERIAVTVTGLGYWRPVIVSRGEKVPKCVVRLRGADRVYGEPPHPGPGGFAILMRCLDAVAEDTEDGEHWTFDACDDWLRLQLRVGPQELGVAAADTPAELSPTAEKRRDTTEELARAAAQVQQLRIEQQCAEWRRSRGLPPLR